MLPVRLPPIASRLAASSGNHFKGVAILLAMLASYSPAWADKGGGDTPQQSQRTIHAEVVALDQAITYNRFGSINPYAMMFALRRDVVDAQEQPLGAPDAIADSGHAGNVRLRAGKRPRPMVLRGNVGDRLTVTFTNLLRPTAPNLSDCDRPILKTEPYSHHCSTAEGGQAVPVDGLSDNDSRGDGNWPATRHASISIPGLRLVQADAQDPRCTALEAIAPGSTITCSWELERQGSFLATSLGAPVGGEGEGGSQMHGLFAVVNVQPSGSAWYRSQLTAGEMDKVWQKKPAGDDAFSASASRSGSLNYAEIDLLKPRLGDVGQFDLTSSDINAVVNECAALAGNDQQICLDRVAAAQIDKCRKVETSASQLRNCRNRNTAQLSPAFREFTVVFHDEIKAFYAKPFQELEASPQLAGIGDGFAINYGASGMGTALLANRKGIGPAKDCAECVYEEFFLQSWANGDPALLEQFSDDPSNVHHSYLNDRVIFRNLHVGKETHVFHLHAHQWETLPQEEGQGGYLDSQTIGPGQTFSYEIYRGGLRHYVTSSPAVSEATNGSGNRNRTVGDSIFHCHLYPHFAQGMWALWRVHDVIEDGTRSLPDGEGEARLSNSFAAAKPPRLGTDPETGANRGGTPIPALVPLPAQPLPPLPTYGTLASGVGDAIPGYPFFIEGKPGRRTPQPPMDFAAKSGSDGGLPRHLVKSATRGMAHMKASEISAVEPSNPAAKGRKLVERALALGDMTAELETADITLLDPAGTTLEKRGMSFHAGAAGRVRLADGSIMSSPNAAQTGYPSLYADRTGAARFFVNGSLPAPGAPFADPCRVGGKWDPANPQGNSRQYDVSAVQLDLVTNSSGWHDPQARINVLDTHLDRYGYSNVNGTGPEGYAATTRGAEPFYFRAESGECITFNHSNRTPKDLELDDFQVATPTDTIGQHIHLVKFDVTSSDGSGNGWNYEDGTFAPDAVFERKCAANAHNKLVGKSPLFPSVSDTECHEFHGASPALKFQMALAKDMVQTTTQRWFADPMLFGPKYNKKGPDRTLGTVFTHDHFGPSSIQQHGFYSALLIEPKGSKWLDEQAQPLSDGVGAVAMITGANKRDRKLHPDTREFAMAIADFALLYDPRCNGSSCPVVGQPANPDRSRDKGIDHLIETAEQVKARGGLVKTADLDRLAVRLGAMRGGAGIPVAPPLLPEGISTDHHDPYLVNYKGEPVPLRIGKRDSRSVSLSCSQLYSGSPIALSPRPASDISAVRDGSAGDISLAFDSGSVGSKPGGSLFKQNEDPCTPVLHAYEGEHVVMRLIQGAQEVQHTLNIQGLGWKRVPYFAKQSALARAATDNSEGRVGAQEVGISEHFEFDIPGFWGLSAGQTADHLYDFGSKDAIWNGAWGLLRVLNSRSETIANLASRTDGLDYPQPLYGGDGSAHFSKGNLAGPNGSLLDYPTGAKTVPVYAVATRMGRLLGENAVGRSYREGSSVKLFDPDALILLPFPCDATEGQQTCASRFSALEQFSELDSWIAAQGGKPLSQYAPFVARVRAGDAVHFKVLNALRSGLQAQSLSAMPDTKGDALLPKISSLNAEADAVDGSKDIATSPHISFSLPLLMQSVNEQKGRAIGWNFRGMSTDRNTNGSANPRDTAAFFEATYFAGLQDISRTASSCRNDECKFRADAIPYAFGPVPIKPLGDFVDQQAHGLFGAIIVQPQGVEFAGEAAALDGRGTVICAPSGTSASHRDYGPMATCLSGRGFREFVLFYQDGLNLHKEGTAGNGPVKDCPICDDSYDRGEKGVNYRSEPFWARLNETGQTVPTPVIGADGQPVEPEQMREKAIDENSNLNFAKFDPKVWMAEHKVIATPEFVATAGETVKFRVIQPGGRARQRSFQLVSNDYTDLLPFAVESNGDRVSRMGSPAAAIMAPGKAITATVNDVRAGCYIYRDGPTSLLSGGVWGSFKVTQPGSDNISCSKNNAKLTVTAAGGR